MDAIDQTLRRVKLRDLRLLLLVVEAGSMTRAAQTLSVSRPVISKTIADLEHTLGVRLLDRHPHRLEPTVFGHALLRRSAAVFDELRQSVREIQFLSNPEVGQLRIGVSEYMAAGLVPAVIDRVSRNRPNLTFSLELADPFGQLRRRQVEFVVARLLTPDLDADLEAEPLFCERVFIAAGPGSKWVGRRKVAPVDLVHEPWILAPPEIVQGSPVVEFFQDLGLPVPSAKVLGLSLPLRNGLLVTGRFLTMVPGSVLRYGAERTLLKPLPVQLPSWRLPVAIVRLKGRTLAPLADLFLSVLRELARPLSDGPARPVRNRLRRRTFP
jgi:DNA-binding transcriptional LysR family regulator